MYSVTELENVRLRSTSNWNVLNYKSFSLKNTHERTISTSLFTTFNQTH